MTTLRYYGASALAFALAASLRLPGAAGDAVPVSAGSLTPPRGATDSCARFLNAQDRPWNGSTIDLGGINP